MTAHGLVHLEEGRRVVRSRLIRLGWSDFWLVGGILAGLIALVLLVFFTGLSF
jgi:hypothetical protein